MSEKAEQREIFRKQFVNIAQELVNHFPELDLRFNLKNDSSLVRYKAAAISDECYELDLSESNPTELVHQAIFNLKQLTQTFDA